MTSIDDRRRNRPRRPVARLAGRVLGVVCGLVVVLLAVAAVMLSLPLAEMPPVGVTGDVLVRNVAVVDVARGAILPARDVLVRDGRIASIGASAAGTSDDVPGLRVVEGAGKFLMPGLWDMHVHSLKISPQYTHPLFIANGVTGVREMWSCASLPDTFVACSDDVERWRVEIRAGTRLASRYVQRSSFAINGAGGVPGAAPAFFRARTQEEARALVAHHSADGVDLLKTYTDLMPAAYDALAAEARVRGVHFAGHLPIRVPLETALAAGQRSIEHPRLFLRECYGGAAAFRALPDPMSAYTTDMRMRLIDERDPVQCSQAMTEMASSGTWWTPTVQVLRMGAFADDRAFRDDARRRYVPGVITVGIWGPDADGAAARGTHASGRRVDAELYALALQDVRRAHAAGVRILAGTDAGDTYVFPGFSMHDEMAELVRAGLTPAAALRSATLDPARFSGRDRLYGSIEAGKMADMVLLDADPLADIHNTGRIRSVFFNGQYLDRPALDRLLAFAEEQAGSVRTNVHLLWGALRSPVMQAQFAD